VKRGVADLRDYLRVRDDAEAVVAERMRSYLLDGRDDAPVVVLLHGLTASPPAWAAIADELQAQGATVLALRLPLHGHRDRLTTALLDLRVDRLTSDLADVIRHVARLERPIVIGGHSLGGTLAIHAAATLPGIDRIVAIAPFLGIAGFPTQLGPLLVPLLRSLRDRFFWWDPTVRENQQPDHGYPRYPLHALAVGLEIAARVDGDDARPARTRAVDLVINARESSVSNSAVRRLARRWRRAGVAVTLHQLDGLPPSHDIVEPLRSGASRARATLVALLMGRSADRPHVTHAI
jgi:alpha-beta hydrolase superfamily lysophospholipase